MDILIEPHLHHFDAPSKCPPFRQRGDAPKVKKLKLNFRPANYTRGPEMARRSREAAKRNDFENGVSHRSTCFRLLNVHPLDNYA